MSAPPIATGRQLIFRGALALLMAGLLILAQAGGSALPAALTLIAAGLFAPPLALLAAYATLPLTTPLQLAASLTFSPAELALFGALAGTALRWRGGPLLRRSALDLPIALFVLAALLSLLVSEYLRLSLRELRTVVLEPITAFYLLLRWFPGLAVSGPVIALVTGATGVALAGLLGAPAGWGVSQAEGVLRLQASYSSGNHLALLLGRALPWAIALGWVAGRGRPIALLAAAVMTLALLATYSLGGWLASLAAIVVTLWLLFRAGDSRPTALVRRALPAAAVVGIILITVIGLLQRSRLESLLSGRGTGVLRLQLWQSALAMLADHPWLGVGLDNFLYLYQQRYIAPTALVEANLSHPHNLVLHFWLALGLPGLIAICWLLFSQLRRAVRAARLGDRLSRALAAGAAGSITSFVAHGMVDNSYFLPDLALIFWLTAAVAASLAAQSDSARGVQ